MPGTTITVPPNVNVPGPFANYDSVTITSPGALIIYQQTTVTITTLTKN